MGPTTATDKIDLEPMLTYEPSMARYSNVVGVPPPLASPPRFRSTQRRRQQYSNSSGNDNNNNETDLRHLLDTLRAFSTAMPNRLVKVNGEVSVMSHHQTTFAQQEQQTPTTWRDAAAFREYNRVDGNGINRRPWGTHNRTTAAIVEPIIEEEEGEIEEEDEQQQEEEEELELTEYPTEALIDTRLNDEEIVHFFAGGNQAAPSTAGETTTISTRRNAEEESKTTTTTTTRRDAGVVNVNVNQIEHELRTVMGKKRQNLDSAIELFEIATVANNLELSMPLVYELFRLTTANGRPFHSYQLLQYILQRSNNNNNSMLTSTSMDPPFRSNKKSDNNDSDDDDAATAASESESEQELLKKGGGGLDDEQLAWLYSQMVFSIRALDPKKDKHSDIRSLVGSVVGEIRQLDLPVQKRCIPELVTSLVIQKSSRIGHWAKHHYNYMTKQLGLVDELPASYYLNLLSQSKHSRKQELPYHDVLYQVVSKGLRPSPQIVLQAVENMFPYTDNVRGTYIALQSILELQTQTQQLLQEQQEEISFIQNRLAEINNSSSSCSKTTGTSSFGNFTAALDNNKNNINEEEVAKLSERLSLLREPDSYIMDITSLEYMTDAANKRNYVDLVLLVWDALDVMGLDPSEAIYEATILCFAKNVDLVENAFVVLKDMEEKNFTPSLPFLAAFGYALRDDLFALAEADRIVEAFRTANTDSVTPSALTAVMVAHAWRGQVQKCLHLLDVFRDSGWSPSKDCFAFALESVGKGASRLKKNPDIQPQKRQSLVETYSEATEVILSRFEEARDNDGNPIVPSHHFVRHYVELLCEFGDTATAGLVARDFLEQQGSEGQLVNNKTLWRVALANAEEGDFDTARKFAASTSEVLPFMEMKIDSVEKHASNSRQNQPDFHEPIDVTSEPTESD